MIEEPGVDAEGQRLAGLGMLQRLLGRLHPAQARLGLFVCLRRGIVGTLLKDDDVGDHLGAGVLGECRARQARGTDQVGALCDPLPGAAVLGVEELVGDHHHQHAARPKLVDGLGEEVVVDAEAGVRTALRIDDGLAAERWIAHRHVEELARDDRILEAALANLRLRVQRGGDLLGQRIEFDAEQFGCIAQLRRHAAEEVADADRRLQNPPPRDAQAREACVHAVDDGFAGVVRIEDGRPRRAPLRVRQQPLQFRADLRPLRIGRVEHAFERAPADVAGQLLALIRCRDAVLGGQCLHDADRGEVVPRLAHEPALAKIVRQALVGGRRGVFLFERRRFVGYNGRGRRIIDRCGLFVYACSSLASSASSSS